MAVLERLTVQGQCSQTSSTSALAYLIKQHLMLLRSITLSCRIPTSPRLRSPSPRKKIMKVWPGEPLQGVSKHRTTWPFVLSQSVRAWLMKLIASTFPAFLEEIHGLDPHRNPINRGHGRRRDSKKGEHAAQQKFGKQAHFRKNTPGPARS